MYSLTSTCNLVACVHLECSIVYKIRKTGEQCNASSKEGALSAVLPLLKQLFAFLLPILEVICMQDLADNLADNRFFYIIFAKHVNRQPLNEC